MRKRILILGLVLVLCLGLAVPAFAAGQTFADVPAGHWAYGQIERAYGEGAISGTSYNDKTGVRLFSPDSPLTGVQFTAMLCKRAYAEASGMPENGWNGGALWACFLRGGLLRSFLAVPYPLPYG